MYSVRVNNRLPQQVYRVCRAPAVASNATRAMSLFPRLIANDFAPMFRLMNDYANQIATRPSFNTSISTSYRQYSPRFDVKETSEAYELQGELPGIDQNDLNIEFTDAQTLSIKGRTETHREEGTRPSQSLSSQAEPAKLTEKEAKDPSEAAPSETSSYHKPTVEEEEVTMSGANPDAASSQAESTVATPAERTAEVAKQDASAPAPAPHRQQQPDSSRYWVSERSVGTFHRSFAFPARVDQDSVRASLSNGILSIVVPKVAASQSKRITIQ